MGGWKWGDEDGELGWVGVEMRWDGESGWGYGMGMGG